MRSSWNSDVRDRSRRERFGLSAIQHGASIEKMSEQTKRALVILIRHVYMRILLLLFSVRTRFERKSKKNR